MALQDEIAAAAQEIVTDGYEMSLGELMSLYKDGELIINPEFQRYFRWDSEQKTKFIESILLGIPIPAIFVFQTESGVWELVDGLQRLSTVFEFTGVLKRPDGSIYDEFSLDGTKLLPSLHGKRWETPEAEVRNSFTKSQQLQIRRARMRVEILKKESDPQSKYELFQRLNTGGSALSEQEVRNCIMVMVNRDFYRWIIELSDDEGFKNTVDLSDNADKMQKSVEMALRFVVYRNIPYKGRLDVHEYLDNSMLDLASSDSFDYEGEKTVFHQTFSFLNDALGSDSFKRMDRASGRFLGQFSLSAYEAIVPGLSSNLAKYSVLLREERDNLIKRKVVEIWNDPIYSSYSGAGIRGTTRLTQLLPLSNRIFGDEQD